MTLKAFFSAARRYWLTFLVVAIVAFAVGLTAILLAPKKYVSSTRLMVTIEGSTTAAAYQNEEIATRRVQTYLPLITSGVATKRVIDELGLPLTPTQLADQIDVANVPPRTPLIDIEVTDNSPARASQIAKTLAEEFVVYAAALETPTGEDSQKVHTTVVTEATPGRENRLVPLLLGVLAGVTALLLAAVAVWIRARRGGANTCELKEAVAKDYSAAEEGVDEHDIEPIKINGSATNGSAPTTEDPVEATQSG